MSKAKLAIEYWEAEAREQNRKFRTAFAALNFIYSGVREGDIKGKPIAIGVNDPNATEWGMMSLQQYIEKAFEKIGGIEITPEKPKRKRKASQ